MAIENARPYFYTLADGYLGLGADLGWNKKEGAKRLNFIDQMFEHGIIKEKTFGIHTKLYNATALESKPSEIRIGGINHDLLNEGRMLAYFDTVNKNTWEIPLKNIHFHDQDILEMPSTALINPAYPFIAAPIKEFERYKDDLNNYYTKD